MNSQLRNNSASEECGSNQPAKKPGRTLMDILCGNGGGGGLSSEDSDNLDSTGSLSDPEQPRFLSFQQKPISTASSCSSAADVTADTPNVGELGQRPTEKKVTKKEGAKNVG